MTHAWLIIAHNEFGILQRLISALDAQECDFYVHIDKKVKQLPKLTTKAGKLTILNDRVDVRWGSVSQIECELALLKAAIDNGDHDYYHIISGTTLPLKPLEQIEVYFEDNAGKSILSGLCKSTPNQETLKVRRYNLFLRSYASDGFIGKTAQFLWKVSHAIQRSLGIEINQGCVFYKASNWLSLTQEAAEYIISKETVILKTYRYSFCGDEFFIPSELIASPLKDNVINSEKYLLHNISRSNASTYSLNEFDGLCDTEYLFARKFIASSSKAD